jgi:hypothetical protein
LANPITRTVKAIVRLFEPPQIDGYLILTDYYGFSHGSGGYIYPILIKLDKGRKNHENVPNSPTAPTPFKAVIKTINQKNTSDENPGTIFFQSKITSKD